MTHTPISTVGQDSRFNSDEAAAAAILAQPEPVEIVPTQTAMDAIDEALMESFPCSDPPSYTRCHA